MQLLLRVLSSFDVRLILLERFPIHFGTLSLIGTWQYTMASSKIKSGAQLISVHEFSNLKSSKYNQLQKYVYQVNAMVAHLKHKTDHRLNCLKTFLKKKLTTLFCIHPPKKYMLKYVLCRKYKSSNIMQSLSKQVFTSCAAM